MYTKHKYIVCLAGYYYHHCYVTQIRAAALSGDCSKLSEFSRSFSMHTEACIKRRAAKSLLGSCKTMREATGVVLRNYEACFADTQPFDNHPHTWC